MRHLPTTVLLVVASLQSVASAQRETPGRIDGLLRNARTHQPIRNTAVTLVPGSVPTRNPSANSLTVTTNEAGRFSFREVTPGPYTFNFPPDAYVRDRKRGGPRMITVAPGQEIKDVQLGWIDGGSLSGKIVDSNGRPLRGVYIGAIETAYPSGHRVMTYPPDAVVSATQTNDIGEYHLFSLHPGNYFLRATDNENKIRFIYFPATFDPSAAASIPVSEGSDVVIPDFKMPPAAGSGVTLSGRVVSQSGEAVSGLTGLRLRPHAYDTLAVFSPVGIDYSGIWNVAPAQSLSNGGFAIPQIPPGIYDLFAALRGRPLLRGRRTVVVKDADVEEIQLIVEPGAELKARVVIDGNRAAVNLSAIAVALAADYGLSLRRNAAADGTILFEDVPEARYRITTAGLTGTAYVADVRQDQRSVYAAGATVAGSSTGLEVLVKTDGGRVEGIVQDDLKRPVVAATVALVPSGPDRSILDRHRSANTGLNGEFRLEGIAPGEYQLLAWDYIPEGAHLNSEFVTNYQARAVKVSVSSSSIINVAVPVIAGP